MRVMILVLVVLRTHVHQKLQFRDGAHDHDRRVTTNNYGVYDQ